MRTSMTTQSVLGHRRLSYWNEIIGKSILPFVIDAPAMPQSFDGYVTADRMDFLDLVEVASDSCHAIRTRSLVAEGTDEKLLVLFQLAKDSFVKQDGRTVYLKPGDWTFVATSRPFDVQLTTSGYGHLVLKLPVDKLLPHIPTADLLTATQYGRGRPLSQVTFEFAKNLWKQAEYMPNNAGTIMANTFVELLATGINEQLQLTSAKSRSQAITLLEIKGAIQRQLHNQNLSVDLIASQLHISKSYLHRLFKQSGTTFGRYVLALRLEQCRNDLVDVHLGQRAVSEIAFSWGFNSLNHFSHAFKKEFGVSPREYRLTRH